ncbi:SH3 domain-containing protein [Pelagibacteraceae bacterium]|nr:SH3 domain-containing protein [Pelagibacteraceae bacterium]|tara:strand:- start:312 stop:758 length:447 start_codon:yes stop_codon:yes gene_type:complete
MIRVLILASILVFPIINSLTAKEYFSTLRYNTVNLRQGPSKDYPIKIFYKKKYLPVLVQDVSNNFRKIKDHENNTGWIHVSQLSKKKAALTLKNKVIIFKNSTIFSKPLAVLEKGRLCLISKCKGDWCKIKVDKYSGWVEKKSLWGNF